MKAYASVVNEWSKFKVGETAQGSIESSNIISDLYNASLYQIQSSGYCVQGMTSIGFVFNNEFSATKNAFTFCLRASNIIGARAFL